MKATLDLYFDIVSPYAWIAFEVGFSLFILQTLHFQSFLRYASKLPVEIRFKPFHLAGIMKASQNRPPATVPAKGIQLIKDLEYLGRYWGIPIHPPSVNFFLFIFSLLNILRTLLDQF